MSSDAPEPPRYRLGPRPFERVNPAPADTSSPPIKVEAILQDNLARTRAQEPDGSPPARGISRRWRDYGIVLLLANGPLLVLAATFRQDPLVVVLTLSGALLLTLTLTWVMWVVMDRN